MADTEIDSMADPLKTQDIVSTTGNDDTTSTTDLVSGDNNGNESGRKVKKIIRKKRRPARPQVDPAFITSEPPPQTGTIFNIWYNKWSGGDREDKVLSQTHAKGRCNVAKDSGFTRADGVAGSFFCLFFARGICPKGQDCLYLHRLPTIHDMFNPNVDCFGRDKFSDYRDDMGGVGSFMRQNRTVYVGRIHVTDDVEEVVARHFAEWGQVERIRVLNARGVAFITYTNEANAQFAKESMAHQSLDHDEVLNVRWATADPNPMAQAREARRIEEQAAEAIRRALPAEFVAEIEGRDPEARKRRKVLSSYGLDGYEAPDDVHFARGENAVNPLGRQGYEVEGAEERLMLEEAPPQSEGKEQQQDDTAVASAAGFLPSSTLAALGTGVVSVAVKPKKEASGPLVAYDSDDDEDED
ncbi:Pre-mRNA-splicing factor CWC2 [Ceratocystis fimbriata CBS 114723]|uniref:Pre-mRNA-splicing factor CWC2 n=1 Tax=Ceratocystis fimbriata CBS 114723 TaxID=1035309 RepID=A0A2C5XII1_9PEZI|nr:Pre-mRNA-splicing factor CWC2 [Ceratocystis fimbriata CBS 114723]